MDITEKTNPLHTDMIVIKIMTDKLIAAVESDELTKVVVAATIVGNIANDLHDAALTQLVKDATS